MIRPRDIKPHARLAPNIAKWPRTTAFFINPIAFPHLKQCKTTHFSVLQHNQMTADKFIRNEAAPLNMQDSLIKHIYVFVINGNLNFLLKQYGMFYPLQKNPMAVTGPVIKKIDQGISRTKFLVISPPPTS